MVSEFLSSLALVLRNFIWLIFAPYKTLRKISEEKDWFQIVIILFLVFVYFKFIYFLRKPIYPATVVFIFFLANFFLTVGFFYLISRIFNKKINFRSFLFTFSYSLFPTLIWFIVNSLLYRVLPPPRTFSLLGRGFSIFFIAFSISLLLWKMIVLYLSVRFSSRQNFYRIIFMIILYLAIFLPATVIFYRLKIFRIPFI